MIERDGRFLITRRQPGVHLDGHWEFPGGKCEPGETLHDCLSRELREELDVERHGRRRDAHDDARLSGATGRAAFLRCELERRTGAAARSGDAVGRRADELTRARVSSRRRRVDPDAHRADRTAALTTLALADDASVRRPGSSGLHARHERQALSPRGRAVDGHRRARLNEVAVDVGQRDRPLERRRQRRCSSRGRPRGRRTGRRARRPERLPFEPRPTSFRATRPWPRCSTRMITSCPT